MLSKEKKNQLKEILKIYQDNNNKNPNLGFDRKLVDNNGLYIRFSGESDNGKTMAAEFLANELKLDLYKIDLSAITSKYIGETEKSLNKIFKEAKSSKTILFFDEADALFGKRTEIKDAHERYANIETYNLLQRIEEYEGIVILATNSLKNMDEAFSRKIYFCVDFSCSDKNSARVLR